MKGKIKAVLLDFDGTIVKFTFDSQRAKAEIIEMLPESRLPQNLFKPEYRISELFNKIEEYINTNPPKEDRERAKTFKNRAEQIVERYEMEGAKNTALIEGIKKVLEEIRERGLKLAVITNNSIRPTRYALQKIGLANFFDVILTRDATQFMKPHPQPIHKALKKLGVHPSEAIFIGDSPIDIRASKEAGVAAIGVTTGVANEEILRTSGAKIVIYNLERLISIIESECKNI